MHALILAALASAPTDEPALVVKLDTLTLKDAERLDGRFVVTTFTVGFPAYTWGEGANLFTVAAPRGSVGSAHLKGNRLHDTDTGARVTVLGTLRVVRGPPGCSARCR
jgi:hypothetical protein